jgi:NAD(P)-dependent dehydrogenase (short-subunit alcohol dehydrogenase family)
MRSALVTGGAGGIGRAVAQRFLSEGVSVALVDVGQSGPDKVARELQPASGAKVIPYAVDVRDGKQVADCVAGAFSELGEITYLVNAAGISTSGLVVDVTEAEWDRVFAINTRGAFLFSKHVAAGMIQRKTRGGRIVNFASQAAKIGELGNGAYCASKAAVVALTQVLGLELAPHGISVTALCPGYVDTEMMRKVFRERGPIEGMTPLEYEKRLVSGVPLGRMVKPEEIAALVFFLCSPDAEMITGVTVTIAGGKVLI